MLLLLDFDGTITDEDTIDVLVRAWAPDVWEQTEAGIAGGTMTLNAALVQQLAGVRATHEEVLEFLRERVVLRPGLADLIAFCRERFVEPVIVSSGFHELIEPILEWHDIALPIVAHRATFDRSGATITFLDRTVCAECGEECKRADAARLADGRPMAYVGDGWSDRCASRTADLRFARGALATYLGEIDEPYEWFDDFVQVQAGLAGYLAPR